MSKYKHIHHGFQIDPLGVNFTPVQGGIFLIIMQKKKNSMYCIGKVSR